MSMSALHKIMLLGGVDVKDKKEINVEIGVRIKQARESAGLTQDRFAELIGMGTKNVSAIERGTVGISILALQKMCKVLSISSDKLLFEGEPENDVDELCSHLKKLSAEQFDIAEDILNKLLEAFSLKSE